MTDSADTAQPGADTTTRKDWATDQEVRWCPGCGDYGVLAQQLFSAGQISESHYYELMAAIGVNPLDIQEEMENGG